MNKLLNNKIFFVPLFVFFLFIAVPAKSSDKIDPEADKILKSMFDYIGGLSSFRIKADVDNEIIDLEGQKLQLSSDATIIIKRPRNIYMHRHGAYAEVEFLFDGEVLTLYNKDKNAYLQINNPGNIDTALNILETEIGLDAPGVDILLENSFSSLISGIKSSAYLGTVYVNGVECHYLAFRSAKVDWQLWVQTGKKPLPMKYIITTKWVTGAPQYSIRFREWKAAQQIDEEQFSFSVPKGSNKLETIPTINSIGELMIEEGQK